MIIEIPGCGFRIKGEDTDWAIQYRQKRGEDGESWNGKYFYGSLEYAVAKAYELALRESDSHVDMDGAVAEVRKTSDKLIKAVRKALKEAAS